MEKKFIITYDELMSRALYSILAILLAIVGFIGIQLWGQVQSNTAHNAAQDVEDAKIITELKSINQNIDGLRRAIEGLIQHEASHRRSERD